VTLHLDTAWLITLMLATMRMTVLLTLTPALGGSNVPPQARIVLLLALTAAMLGAMPAMAGPTIVEPGPLLQCALTELIIGAAMAFGLHCAFGAFSLAGKMLDLQIGFSVGAVFDPVTRAASPMLGTLLTMLGAVLFYAMEGHHMLVRMVAYSFEKVPMGSTLPWQAAKPFVDQFGAMFVFGLTLAAPVVVALFLVDIGLGIVSRTMPQMNVFLISLIVKIIVGLLIFMVALQSMAVVMKRSFSAMFDYWQILLS
jgi:flagellar biosynthetic protein FliR